MRESLVFFMREYGRLIFRMFIDLVYFINMLLDFYIVSGEYYKLNLESLVVIEKFFVCRCLIIGFFF